MSPLLLLAVTMCEVYADDCLQGGSDSCAQEIGVSLFQSSVQVKLASTPQNQKVAATAPGCGCSALRVLYHRHASEKHVMCLKNSSYPACQLYAKGFDKGFQEDTAAGNRYYVDACNYSIDYSCKVGYQEALYYKHKMEEVDGMETPDKRTETPYWQNLLDELDKVLHMGNVGCNCTPPSIYMYRLWSADGVMGGEGNINDSNGFFAQPAIAAVDACQNAVDASCGFDPIEAQFHAIGYRAHKRVFDNGIEKEAPWKGHLTFVRAASGVDPVNEERLAELKEIIRKEASDPNWTGAPAVH
jgi:hypothetical protein